MKNLFLILTLSFGLMSFNVGEEISSKSNLEYYDVQGLCVVTYDIFNAEGEVIGQFTVEWISENYFTCVIEAGELADVINNQ